MVFKVFCDINVSDITSIESKELYENEEIIYEFIPKFDDDKENWDPNETKKHKTATSNAVIDTIISKKENNKEETKEKNVKSLTENEKTILKKEEPKENKLKESIPKVESEEKAKKEDDTVEKIDKKEISKTENVKPVSSKDTTESKENTYSKDSEILIKKKELLGKRKRIPLEDITYLFVPEKTSVSPKRVRIIKSTPKNNEKVNSQEVTPSIKKSSKIIVVSKKENKEALKAHKVLKENSKENNPPKHKSPLGNISNHINIMNNNNNIENSKLKKSSSMPKPCFIDVKKFKPVKRSNIPRKALKSKPNSLNVSARMLR